MRLPPARRYGSARLACSTGIPLRPLGPGRYKHSCLSYTIAIDAVDIMQQKLAEQPDWPIYKIKLAPRETWKLSGRYAR